MESTQSSPDHTTSPDQEHGYETITYTRLITGQSKTNQHESGQEYNILDRGQNRHVATSKILDQRKSSCKGAEGSKESESVYSRLEKKELEGKKDAEEHFYHILEGPINKK